MIENRMLIDSEWETIEKQWIDLEETEYRNNFPKRKLSLKRKIHDEEERKEDGKNDIVSVD